MPDTPNTPTDDLRRRYLEHDYARHHLAGAAAQTAHQNASELEQQHPGLREEALAATADELGGIPAHLRRHQMRRRRELGITPDRARSIREHGGRRREPAEPARRTPPPPRQTRMRPGNPRPNRTPQPPRAVRSAVGKITGAATDTGGIGDTILTALGWGMGLSVLYLLLTHPAGPSRLALGAANATRALVAVNVDPLNPTHHKL